MQGPIARSFAPNVCSALAPPGACSQARKLWEVIAGLAEKEVNIENWKVPELKKYLQARGISVYPKTGKN